MQRLTTLLDKTRAGAVNRGEHRVPRKQVQHEWYTPPPPPDACPLCGGAEWVRDGNGHPLPCQCLTRKRMQKDLQVLREQSGLSLREKGYQFDDYNPQACVPSGSIPKPDVVRIMNDNVAYLRRYANDPQGWVILQGPNGTGKTHLAMAVVSAALERGLTAYGQTFAEILAMLKQAIQEKADTSAIVERIKTVELLVLDDLGAEQATEYAKEILYLIVDYRYRAMLPLVITTTLTLDAMMQIYPRSITSRFSDGINAPDGFSHLLVFPCSDYRPYRTRTGMRRE